jgi:hypothetical protein
MDIAPATGKTALQDLKERIQKVSPRLPDRESAAERTEKLCATLPAQAETQSSKLLPKERIQNVKARVLCNILEYCTSLCPKGYLASKGGYWMVPAPVSIKISFREGKYFDLDNPQSRNPIGDLVELWMASKKQYNFKRAIAEIERWCDTVEKRPTPYELERNAFTVSELREGVFVCILQSGKIPMKRGTARSLWKLIDHELGPDEFRSATAFLKTLKWWARDPYDKAFFTVTEKSRSRKTEFILEVTPKEDERFLILNRNAKK